MRLYLETEEGKKFMAEHSCIADELQEMRDSFVNDLNYMKEAGIEEGVEKERENTYRFLNKTLQRLFGEKLDNPRAFFQGLDSDQLDLLHDKIFECADFESFLLAVDELKRKAD